MRILADALESALASGNRRPGYKILAFDPALDDMGTIVRGEYTQTPYDLTPYCSDIGWSLAQLSFTLKDPAGIFHPDTGAQKKYLADGAIIRLKEGDTRVSLDNWPWTFTGMIRGQSGWQKARRTQTLESKVTAFSRDNCQGFKRRMITSKEYTVGTEVGAMLYDILQAFLGLSPGEIRIPPVLGLQLRHMVNQLAQVTPWDAISVLLETVSKTPFFDGEGRIACIDKNLNRLPDRILPDYIKVFDYQITARNQDSINKVRVTFLDSALERVDSPYQKLGAAQVTTGFFSMHEKLECWWSEDHKQRADGTTMRVIKSVNSGLLPVGVESYQQVDEFHGEINIAISVWVPILATVMLGAYLAAAAIPDKQAEQTAAYALLEAQVDPVSGHGAAWGNVFAASTPEGVTIPYGKVIQAAAMGAISLIMMSMGSAQYEIWGTPYDMAYTEKESIAIKDGLNYWDEIERQIKNDFLGSYEQADSVALTELIWEESSSYPRRLILEDDLALELGDILALADGRKFLITNMQKSIKRGEIPQLTLDGFKVMTA